jgi:hypothetical protein
MWQPVRACTASASTLRASHAAASAERVSRQPRIGVSGRPRGVVVVGVQLVDGLPDELDDSCRLVLAGVLALRRLSLLRLGVEDLRPNRGRTDVDGQDAWHEPYPYSPWPC